MTTDITRLRAAAKQLKKAFAAGDPDAARRLQAFAPDKDQPKHADFLHVIARENGHDSWPKLKFALESQAMTRDQRAERLKIALYFGQPWVAARLLEDDPSLASHNLGLQIALYDAEAVEAALADPSRATEKIGIRSPILHLAYSKYIHMAPEKRGDMLRIADLLVANGADVNDAYPYQPGSEHEISALYGALGHANNLALAEWLLENGATPDDNESLYHATELGHHDGLKLLMRFGVKTAGTNALLRALDFDDLEAVRLLLDYGADPQEKVPDHPSGEPVPTLPALHQAARRGRAGETARLLIEYGADPTTVWNGHTAYGLARIYGNDSFAGALEDMGHASRLTPVETALAECAAGRIPPDRLNLSDLSDEARRLLNRLAAEPGALDHIKALVGAGLDPDTREEMGMSPLHLAGWEGVTDTVAYLLTLSPDLEYENDYGGDALGTVIHGAEFCPNAAERDHIACARLLLDAGSELRQREIDGCGSESMAAFLEDWQSGSTENE